MKWIIYILLLAFFVILFTVLFFPKSKMAGTPQTSNTKGKTAMKISSSAFQHNTQMPKKYTCDGDDRNPPLTFEDIPSTTQSLLLIVDDPDAPSGTWTHWTIYNMDPKTTSIAENSHPQSGKEGITDFGKTGYGGPCPPSGTHRYFFKLYALNTMLDLPEKATLNEITNAMQNHIIAEAELIGLYSRSK